MKFFYFQNFVFRKKKIIRVEENECEEKKKYDWCVFKKKNIDAHGEL